MSHVEVLGVCVAPQAGLRRHIIVPADAAGHAVHAIKRLFKSDQIHAGPSLNPVLVTVAHIAHPAKVLDLPLTPDILQVPGALEKLERGCGGNEPPTSLPRSVER